MSVPNLNRISLFVQKLLGGPKISKLSQVTLSHANLGVILWSVVYIYAKFEADISIRCKVIRGCQNCAIWSRDPGHAHFGVILWFARRRGASSMYVPNLKRIALFVQKLLGVPKFRNWVT